MTGHLFVVHGDMTKLDSDAVVLPCDEGGNITAVWKDLLPAGQIESGPWGLRLKAPNLDEGFWALLGEADGREVAVAATAGGVSSLDVGELVSRVLAAVAGAADSSSRHLGRQLPLVALPLVGTGAGGLHNLRGRVVEQLVPALVDLTRDQQVDVALVLNDRRDYAAVQAARTVLDGGGTECWPGLTSEHRERADRLGAMAAHNQLSLFVGSGVSVPLGVPNWHQLLQRMAEDVRPEYHVPERAELLDEAAGFRWLMGDRYLPFMREVFELERHALGHALLAALNIRQMVTTNYDPCFELALDATQGRSYQVMTRSLASGGVPWLLKLHGDIRAPETIVLTRAEYERLAAEGRALHGVVESLMLTSHVLFVGYSLVDHDFTSVAEGVRHIRDQAVDGPRVPSGTALALLPETVDADKWRGQVDVLAMRADGDVHAAARTLEIFLDRVAWAAMQTGELAAEYLLDPRFEVGSTEADRVLRQALQTVLEAREHGAEASAGWPKVERLLFSLGLDGAEAQGDSPVRG